MLFLGENGTFIYFSKAIKHLLQNQKSAVPFILISGTVGKHNQHITWVAEFRYYIPVPPAVTLVF